MKHLKPGVKWLFVVASGTVLLAASPGARLCADDSKLPSKREPYVAEWVFTRDGKGKVIGGSADCPAGPRSNCTPAPEYIDFRVVHGAAKPAPGTQVSRRFAALFEARLALAP